jgi:hypothetical protein
MKKRLFDLLHESYDSSLPEAIIEPMVKTGSASENQLAYIEQLSHGMGDHLADIRFGKLLYGLSKEEASMIIETLTK